LSKEAIADGDCIQTIVHPAVSVWTIASMPNGDIVSGCSDHIVRVFSRSQDRWLSEKELKEYDEQVSNQALPAQQVGDVKTSDLPGPEALSIPGESSYFPCDCFIL
jgi:phospholipase A-2-activating protein